MCATTPSVDPPLSDKHPQSSVILTDSESNFLGKRIFALDSRLSELSVYLRGQRYSRYVTCSIGVQKPLIDFTVQTIEDVVVRLAMAPLHVKSTQERISGVKGDEVSKIDTVISRWQNTGGFVFKVQIFERHAMKL
jgi:hypothetical protein